VCGGSPLFPVLDLQEEDDDMCGGSPLIVFFMFLLCFLLCLLHVGEIHRVEEILYTRSPLSEPEFYWFF